MEDVNEEEAVQLTMKISDEDVKNFTLSGLLVFTDKVIDDETETYIRRMIAMTKIGRMFEQEKIEYAEEKVKENATEIALNLIKAGNNTHEQIAAATGLSLETVKELAGEKAS